MSKMGYLISAVIGAVLGVVAGYGLYAVAQGGGGAVPFGYWLNHPVRYDGIWWALAGALICASIRWLTLYR